MYGVRVGKRWLLDARRAQREPVYPFNTLEAAQTAVEGCDEYCVERECEVGRTCDACGGTNDVRRTEIAVGPCPEYPEGYGSLVELCFDCYTERFAPEGRTCGLTE